MLSCKTKNTEPQENPKVFIESIHNSLNKLEKIGDDGSTLINNKDYKKSIERAIIELEMFIKDIEKLSKPKEDFDIKKNCLQILYDTKKDYETNMMQLANELSYNSVTEDMDINQFGSILDKSSNFLSKFIENNAKKDKLYLDFIAYYKFYKIEIPEYLKIIDAEQFVLKENIKKFVIPDADLKKFNSQKHRFEFRGGATYYNNKPLLSKDLEYYETKLGKDYTLEIRLNTVKYLHYNKIPITVIFSGRDLWGYEISLESEDSTEPFFILIDGYPFNKTTTDFGDIMGVCAKNITDKMIDILYSLSENNYIIYTDIKTFNDVHIHFSKEENSYEVMINPN